MQRLTGWIVMGLTVFICAREADAATRTWTGTNSGLWSDAGNWGGTAPVAGDDLVFASGALNTTNTNDFPAGTQFNSITIQQPYVLTGNAIVLGAGGIQVAAGGMITYGLATTLAVDQTWSSTPFSPSLLQVTGAIHLNGHTLTFNAGGSFNASGVIDGSGAIVKSGFQPLTLSGANTYAGPTTITASRLEAASPTALGVADGTSANGTTVAAGASLRLQGVALGTEAVVLNGTGGIDGGALTVSGGASSLAGPVTLASNISVALLNAFSLTLTGIVSGPGQLGLAWDGSLVLANGGNSFTGGINVHAPVGPPQASLVIGADHAIPGTPVIDLASGNTLVLNGHAQTLAGVTGTGTLNTTAAPSVLTLNGSGDTTFAGIVTGSGVIDHTGTGHQTFSGASTFSGPLLVDHGIVTVSTGTLPAPVTVNNDGRFSLTANGTAGAITVNAGHLQLTEGGAAIGNSRTVTLNSAATLDVGGAAPTALGSLKVTGGVTLGGATLALQLPAGFSPAPGATFTLIDNDGTDPVNGTFAGLPEGASLTVGAVVFRISYVGGSGNDVVLTATASGAVTYLLSEGATGGFFTTDLLLANPNNQAAAIGIMFLKDDGTTVTVNDTLPAMSHKLIRVNNVPGMEAAAFSTIVRSLDSLPLAVERTMSWDRSG